MKSGYRLPFLLNLFETGNPGCPGAPDPPASTPLCRDHRHAGGLVGAQAGFTLLQCCLSLPPAWASRCEPLPATAHPEKSQSCNSNFQPRWAPFDSSTSEGGVQMQGQSAWPECRATECQASQCYGVRPCLKLLSSSHIKEVKKNEKN